MQDQQALWLSQADQARLASFKAYAVNHPLLEDVDARLTQALLEPAGFAHVLVYGPSGVGKTTMLWQIARRAPTLFTQLAPQSDASNWKLARGSPALPPQPLLVLEGRPPDGGTFNRADYYRSALTQLGEAYYQQWSLVDIQAEQTWETKTRSKGRGTAAQFHDSPELRQALEEAIARRGVRAVIIDEAQHLMKVASGAKLLDQLDWLKSLTNTTGVVHALIGTYDLLDFRNLNGQAARRGQDLHFPRYQFQHEADRRAFQGALHSLLQQIPLDVDRQDLMNHWFYCYERSIGCVGILKDWLVRAVASALHAGTRTLTLAHLEQHALSNAQCERMAADANAAEQKLHYTESRREHLWNLLGMSGVPMHAGFPVGTPNRDHGAAPAGPRGSSSQAATGRVGQRAPGRDPVGEVKPEERPTKCPFAGVIELSPERMTRTAVSRVECPSCGALRTLHPQGATVLFPSHPKRLTRPPREEARWIRRGSLWELSDKKA
jgi:DNA polymerase III delta prime subunit